VSVTAWSDRDLRAALEGVYHQVIERIDAGRALRRALQKAADAPREPVHIIAVGKAASAMAQAAADWLRHQNIEPAQSLIIGPRGAPSATDFRVVAGDHPLPAAGSLEAAGAVARLVDRVAPGDTVWLLLSGGASSLMAGPVAGVSSADLTVLFDRLHSAGLDIHAMNAVRKRFLVWGAGRLAAALAPAPCQAFVVSDVPGDSIPSIGSGPVSPDDTTVADVSRVLDRAGLLDGLPDSLQANIAGIEAGQVPETAKPGDPVFDHVTVTVVATNRDAVIAAEAYGRSRGWTVHADGPFLAGEASEVGHALGVTLVDAAAVQRDTTSLFVWGSETVVTFDSPPTAPGGRCQELALAAARSLSAAEGTAIGLLAAGTDGRDGPTDAAGAIVTAGTWRAMQVAGADPGRALSGHASYQALSSAEALFAPGPTGTNVMDIVVGIVAPGDQG
jgi:hydroxypyruvate reductase